MSTHSIFFYFNGTPMELTHSSESANKSLEYLKQQAHKMLADGVRGGISLTQLGNVYHEQLVEMENLLRVTTGKAVGGVITQQHLEQVAKQFELPDVLSLKSMWALNILALIKLGRLEDDDMNGVMMMD